MSADDNAVQTADIPPACLSCIQFEISLTLRNTLLLVS